MLRTVWASTPPVIWLSLIGLLVVIVGVWLLERRRRQRTEAENRAILSSGFADLVILRRDGLVEACNDDWARATETSNPFTQGKPGQPLIPPDDAPAGVNPAAVRRVREALGKALAGGQIDEVIDYAWLAGSQWKWSSLRVRHLERKNGGAVVAHVDITARKRVEAEAQSALHQLAHMNMRAGMGEVVSAVAHELTQSLTASLSNAQTLKRMLAEHRLTFDDLPPIVDDISDANRQAIEILSRIRSLMRKEEFDMRPLDFNAIVMEVVQVLYSSAANDGVLLIVDLEAHLPPVSGDRVQLRQVAMNLILNAVQATRGHDSPRPIVRVSTAIHSGSISLAVDDAGSGIEEDVRQRIFEPYFTTKAGGLGVGLSISRSIVQSHGGSIDAENLPQGGARFLVTLPLELSPVKRGWRW